MMIIKKIWGLIEDRENRGGGNKSRRYQGGEGKMACSLVIQGSGDWVGSRLLRWILYYHASVYVIAFCSFISLPNSGDMNQGIAN